MKKSGMFLLFSLLLPLCLSGCVEDYDKQDIEALVEEKIGITDFTVSDETYTFIESDGYEDIVWSVTDNALGITFHVVDDFGWGMESVSNYLWNDYAAAVLTALAPELPPSQYLYAQTQVDENGLYTGWLQADFTSLAELEACTQELVALRETFATLGAEGVDVRYRLEYQHPLRNTTPSHEETSGDSSGSIQYDFSYQEMKNEVIQTDLDYRYDTIANYTAAEIAIALEDYRYCIGLYQGTETERSEYATEDIVYYDDIIANKYAYGISFGSLYEILLREGYSVEGDAWHYTFIGVDGVVYEISYDFVADLYDGESGYYYLADQVQTPMRYYFYNHFSVLEAQELTGLRFVIGSRP